MLTPRRAEPGSSMRPTRAEVSLGNLRRNLAQLQRLMRVPVWSVLKADAYGHGSKAVARTLERAGTAGVCVALVEEAIELREAGIMVPILVLGGTYHNALPELLEHRLTPVVSHADQLAELAEEARFAGVPPVAIHVKLDTGMARLGVPEAAWQSFAAELARRPELRLEAAMTHFACAENDPQSVLLQLERFERACAALRAQGIAVSRRHAANTAAALTTPEARFDMVRPGIGLFGMAPGVSAAPALEPVMRVRTEIVALRDLPRGSSVGYGATWTAQRDSRVATIPMGYADGLSRALSNRGEVLVRGKRAPLVGTVSMDLTTLDVTQVPGAELGDEVVVLGSQKGPLGEATLSAEEVAQKTGTIAWEVLTSVSRRVPRFYREDI